MKMNIFYRSPIVWNIILFSFFSLAFVLLQNVYVNISTVMSSKLVLDFLLAKRVIIFIGLLFLTIFTSIRLMKSAKFFYFLMVIWTFAMTLTYLEREFSKIIIVMTFFYLVIAYYLYQFLKIELDESYYNANYSEDDLFNPMLKRINIILKTQQGDEISRGYLTNWSEEGCFVFLLEKVKFKNSCILEIHFGEKIFTQKCIVSSRLSSLLGYGLKFEENSKQNDLNLMNWNKFYEIIVQLGYSPELVR